MALKNQISYIKTLSIMDFKQVATEIYPNEPHMQECIEPKWIASLIKSDLGMDRPALDSITVESAGDGHTIDCDFQNITNRYAKVFVNGQHIANYGPSVVQGKYKGETLQKV